MEGIVKYINPVSNEAVIRYRCPRGCPLYFHVPSGDLKEGDKVEITITKIRKED